MKISDDAVLALRESYTQFDVNCPKDYNTFSYFARGLPIEQSVKAVVCMFVRLKFVEHWRIPSSTLVRFVLAIQRSYRNPSYHNWTHAFCVGHFAYLCMVNAEQRIHEFLSPLELLALLVGALCHDIDHRGLNNSFQQLINSPLSSLYGMYGSVLERHHVEHTMQIIQTANCNIFCNLSPEDEKRALQLVRHVILATDLEAHMKLIPKLRQMSRDGYDSSSEEHRHMLLSLVATASDLSDQCKSWFNSRKAASLIYDEFFHQGKLERLVGEEPPFYMDPQKVCIPESQVVFLDSIVLPCFQTLSKLLPECCEAVHAIQANRRKWKHLTKLVSTNQLPDYSTERLFSGEYDAIAMPK
ncbi:3'5'-cyclic nucleotide phosphodiesterase [Opisthorchis viverrini]|uniref:3'5'-cyclic nucleotide phosphodiesterase n=1 Tax=Opisthorchis viverrini TaxID=6198 RepID=A0A1S8XAY3_OPIVI|nr:3'5'-cyclic nucleotide phosphodiesterase [Opisthorchis viverrini]